MMDKHVAWEADSGLSRVKNKWAYEVFGLG